MFQILFHIPFGVLFQLSLSVLFRYNHIIVLSLGLCQNIAYFRHGMWVLRSRCHGGEAYFRSLLTTRRVGRPLTLPTT